MSKPIGSRQREWVRNGPNHSPEGQEEKSVSRSSLADNVEEQSGEIAMRKHLEVWRVAGKAEHSNLVEDMRR